MNPNQSPYPGYVPQVYPNSVDVDFRDAFGAPATVNPIIHKGNSFHCRTLIATIILLIGIILPIVLHSSDRSFGIGSMIAIFATAYVLYLIIACCCN
jgi:hypothetical protein